MDAAARLLTWLFWSPVADVPVRAAGYLCRLQLSLLLVLLLQLVEELVERRLQRLRCLGAVELPLETLRLQFFLGLGHNIPVKSVLYFQRVALFREGWICPQTASMMLSNSFCISSLISSILSEGTEMSDISSSNSCNVSARLSVSDLSSWLLASRRAF